MRSWINGKIIWILSAVCKKIVAEEAVKTYATCDVCRYSYFKRVLTDMLNKNCEVPHTVFPEGMASQSYHP